LVFIDEIVTISRFFSLSLCINRSSKNIGLLLLPFWKLPRLSLIIIKLPIASFFTFFKSSKILPVHLTFIILLTFTVHIHIESTETTVTAFVIFRLINSVRFLSFLKKIAFLVFTHLKCTKFFILFLTFFIIKTWKLRKFIFASRFILKTTKIRKIKWFFTSLFLINFSLITKLRKMNWFLIIILHRCLSRDSFFLWNFLLRSWWIEGLSNNRKRWSVNRISLWTRNILKLIKIKTLVWLFIFDGKLPALIHLIRIINLRFVLCHCLKWIFNREIFSFVQRHVYFFKWTLLTHRFIFLLLSWWFELIFWCFKWVAWLFIISGKILTCCLERILSFTFSEAFIHLEIQYWRSILLRNLTFTVILKRINWFTCLFWKLWILEWVLNFLFWFIIEVFLRILSRLRVSFICESRLKLITNWFWRLSFPKIRIFIIIRVSIGFVKLKRIGEWIIKRFFSFIWL